MEASANNVVQSVAGNTGNKYLHCESLRAYMHVMGLILAEETANGDRLVTAQLIETNAILQGLEDEAASFVVKHATLAYLPLKYNVYASREPINDVYFPLTAVLSIVTRMKNGTEIEVGTIGREGMSAFPLLMGAETSANDCYCQVPGNAIVISATLFRELSTTSNGFRQMLDRYLQAYVNMLGQLAACNRLHSVYERCARWLLMTHDRFDSEKIPLTHEFLAMMLGTGRSGVTIAAATLQQAGFIHCSRGCIIIRNRAGLEDAACECYEIASKQFTGLLRPVEMAMKA